MWGPILAWVRKQIGQRTDTASATGSLHAKVEYLFDKNIIANDSVIKSIQRGTILIPGGSSSQSATISEVTTTKTKLNYLGQSSNINTPTDFEKVVAKIVLTNSTTVTASLGTSTDGTGVSVSYEVIEYY